MRFYIVDVFAENRYEGNQLLVVIADRPVSDEEQQKICKEINFSETAFILSGKKDNGAYDVRIWTPNTGEVPFAGHPVLGTAFVIREYLEDGSIDEAKLDLKVGTIPVRTEGERYIMSQNAPVFGGSVGKDEIARIFGIDEEDIADHEIQWVSTGLESLIIGLNSRKALSDLKMDKTAFADYVRVHPENNCNHFFFFDRGDHVLDARCLMEDHEEDAATGSANGNLAAYLVKHDYFGDHNIEYTVIQGEDMGRRSLLEIRASYLDEKWTIEVGGRCHLLAEGDWK